MLQGFQTLRRRLCVGLCLLQLRWHHHSVKQQRRGPVVSQRDAAECKGQAAVEDICYGEVLHKRACTFVYMHACQSGQPLSPLACPELPPASVVRSTDSSPAACMHSCVQAVSGLYTSQQFDPATSDFALSFAANATLQSQPTLIYLNEKLYYPNGYVVRLVTWSRLCTCAVVGY